MISRERARRLEDLSPAKRAALLRALQSDSARREGPPPIPRSSLPEPPLSFSQQRLWFLDRLMPGAAIYNVAFAARLRGPLRVEAWSTALARVVSRHRILRTRFPSDRPVQIALPELRPELPLIDLSGLADEVREAEVRRLADAEVRLPFELERPPLLRARLLRLEPGEHCQILTLHHIVCDGWSDGVLLREMAILYAAALEGRPNPLPKPPIQYSDFAVWQREWLQGEMLERQLAYWRERMAGAPPVLDLPLDHPRPAEPSYRTGILPLRMPDVAPALRRLGREAEATPFMTLLTAFQVLLARWTGQDDLVVGTPVANRSRPETEGLIGMLVNTLPLRADLSGDPPFREALLRVRRAVLDGFAHQDLPFERLVDELQPERTLNQSPVFQALFLYQPVAARREETGGAGLAIEALELNGAGSSFDLTLGLGEDGDALAGLLEYARDLFESATAERLASSLGVLLAGIAAGPGTRLSDLPLLTREERSQILEEWNATARELEGAPNLHGLVAAQAARTPDAPAVAFGGRVLTYAELRSRAGRLAARLADLGVRPGDVVAVLLERSLELLPVLLGILEAGAAYLPLDPETPPERLVFQLEDSGARAAVTSAEGAAALPWPAGLPVLPLAPGLLEHGEAATADVPDQSLAYVLYTSGSTGLPKAAMVPHAGIRNRLLWMQRAYGLAAGDRVLQKTPLTFDVSLWELFWPLIAGACVVFARPGGHRDPEYLAGLIREEGITVLHFVPSALQAFLEQPAAAGCRSLRRVVCSGEALPPELAARFHERLGGGTALENLYGPTEASVDVTAWTCLPGAASVPIGRPIDNVRLHVLDRHGQPVPVGVSGELHIGGVALARGYLGRPALTAERFVPDPFAGAPGERLYRTGDLTRRRTDGVVEYLGRIDHQVKIRGFRIELGEIEAALLAVPGVREAVAAVTGDGLAERRLVAYLVTALGAALEAEDARRSLLERLPPYMVPALFVVLADLPRTTSGKVDRRRLPAPDPGSAALRRDYVPPATPVEQALAEIWAAVLRIGKVGAEDNFFALGGDSMNSLQVVTRAREHGITLTVPDLFRHATLRALAAAVTPPEPPAADALLADLLAQVEGLSDQEASALLKTRLEGGAAGHE